MATETPAGPADTASGAATEATAGTAAGDSGPSGGAPPGPAGTAWAPDHPLHRGPATAVDQITVALVRKAAADLQSTHERTGLSKTDIVNRALSLYEFIDAEVGEGAEFIVRRDGHDNLLKML